MHSFLHYITDTKLAPRGRSARRLSHAKALGSWNPPARPESAQRWQHLSAYGSAAKEGNLGRGEAPLFGARLSPPVKSLRSSDRKRIAGRRGGFAERPFPALTVPPLRGAVAKGQPGGPCRDRRRDGPLGGGLAGYDAPSREDGRPRWEGDPVGREGRAFW